MYVKPIGLSQMDLIEVIACSTCALVHVVEEAV